MHHLAPELLHKRGVLPLRIEDQYVDAAPEQQRHDLQLAKEALARAADAQYAAVSVHQLPAVDEDHVLAHGAQAVIDAVLVDDLLRVEGHQRRRRIGGDGAERIDLPQPIWQRRIQPFQLLIPQRGEVVGELVSRGDQRPGVGVQLLPAVRHVYQRQHHVQHTLVARGQVVEELVGLLTLLVQIVRNGGREIVVLVLLALPVGDVSLHAQQLVLHGPDSLIRRHGDIVDGQHHVPGQLHQLPDDVVAHVRRIGLQVQHACILPAQHQMICMLLHALRADEIRKVMPLAQRVPVIERIPDLVPRAEEIVQHAQAILHTHHFADRAQCTQVSPQPCSDALQREPRLLHVLLVHRHRDIPIAQHAAARRGALHQHVVVLLPVPVQRIALERDQCIALEPLRIDAVVVHGDLGRSAHVQRIDQLAERPEHGLLRRLRRHLVVDVRKRPAHAELVPHLKNPIRPDAPNGYGLLHGSRHGEFLPVHLQCGA